MLAGRPMDVGLGWRTLRELGAMWRWRAPSVRGGHQRMSRVRWAQIARGAPSPCPAGVAGVFRTRTGCVRAIAWEVAALRVHGLHGRCLRQPAAAARRSPVPRGTRRADTSVSVPSEAFLGLNERETPANRSISRDRAEGVICIAKTNIGATRKFDPSTAALASHLGPDPIGCRRLAQVATAFAHNAERALRMPLVTAARHGTDAPGGGRLRREEGWGSVPHRPGPGLGGHHEQHHQHRGRGGLRPARVDRRGTNVRELDEAHMDALAGSVALRCATPAASGSRSNGTTPSYERWPTASRRTCASPACWRRRATSASACTRPCALARVAIDAVARGNLGYALSDRPRLTIRRSKGDRPHISTTGARTT